MKTFEIIEKLKILADMKMEVNEETGEFVHNEEDLKHIEAQLDISVSSKLNAIQDFKLSLKDEIARFKEKQAKQAQNIKREEKKIEYMIELQEALLHGEKLKTDEYTFSYRKSEVALDIINEGKLLMQLRTSIVVNTKENQSLKSAIKEEYKKWTKKRRSVFRCNGS